MRQIPFVFVASFSCLIVVTAGSCGGPEIKHFDYKEVSLSPRQIESRITNIDKLYTPPRTLAKVEQCFFLCLGSISRTSRDRVLWRAARATAWLAENLPDEEFRRELSIKGVAIGRESIRKPVDSVEPYFFCALNLGVLSQLFSTRQHMAEMIKLCKKALELDETFDYAGPHRFLGILYYETEGHLLVDTGTLEDALRHLERACEIAPDYGHNHLALALALIEDDQYDRAHEHLDKVFTLEHPEGDETEREKWVQEARKLYRELPVVFRMERSAGESSLPRWPGKDEAAGRPYARSGGYRTT